MKKNIMTLTAILGFAFFTTAQERPTLIDSNDDVQDKLQQEPTRDNQREIERNAKRAAEEKVRKDFFVDTSHELRTPLTSIKGYSAMLLDGDFGKLLT